MQIRGLATRDAQKLGMLKTGGMLSFRSLRNTKTGSVSYRLSLNLEGVPYRKGKAVPPDHMPINGVVKTNNTVELELNIKKRTLTYFKLNVWNRSRQKLQICQFKNIETKNLKYCLSIYMWYQGKITIKSFSMWHVD